MNKGKLLDHIASNAVALEESGIVLKDIERSLGGWSCCHLNCNQFPISQPARLLSNGLTSKMPWLRSSKQPQGCKTAASATASATKLVNKSWTAHQCILSRSPPWGHSFACLRAHCGLSSACTTPFRRWTTPALHRVSLFTRSDRLSSHFYVHFYFHSFLEICTWIFWKGPCAIYIYIHLYGHLLSQLWLPRHRSKFLESHKQQVELLRHSRGSAAWPKLKVLS